MSVDGFQSAICNQWTLMVDRCYLYLRSDSHWNAGCWHLSSLQWVFRGLLTSFYRNLTTTILSLFPFTGRKKNRSTSNLPCHICLLIYMLIHGVVNQGRMWHLICYFCTCSSPNLHLFCFIFSLGKFRIYLLLSSSVLYLNGELSG